MRDLLWADSSSLCESRGHPFNEPLTFFPVQMRPWPPYQGRGVASSPVQKGTKFVLASGASKGQWPSDLKML